MADRMLVRGMQGPEVTDLQAKLDRLGFPAGQEQGQFSDVTEAAVRAVQERHGLPVTGTVDERTAKLVDLLATAPPGRSGSTDGEPAAASATVSGTVAFGSGEPFANARVRALDQELRSQVALGEGATDNQGRYSIAYDPSAATAAGKERPDLVVQVLSAAGLPLASSEVRFDAPTDSILDVTVPASTGVEPSEFERVGRAVDVALQGLRPKDVTSADVAYLAGRTGEQPDLIAAYAAAAKIADATGSKPEAFYGLLRSDLPNSLPLLVAPDPDQHREAIEGALAQNVVPAGTAEPSADLRLATIEKLVDSSDTASAPVLGRVLGQFLESRDERQSFVEQYLDFQGPPDRFWEEVRRSGHLDERSAGTVQFALQATLLADGHAPLVQQLVQRRQGGEFATMQDLARLDADDWLERIGQPADGDRLGAAGRSPKELAHSMERMLEDAFPTAALAGKARKREDSPLHDEQLLQFLDANPSFDLLAPKLDERLRSEAVLPEGVDVDRVRGRLGDVQRLYKLEPRFATADALMRENLTSASAIARLGREAFVETFAERLGHGESSRVYDAADQRSSLALAIYARFGASLNAVLPWATPKPQRADGVPNWETLFGSLDLCECEHCRSIFSPAAYLVDCLAYLDRCKNPKNGSTALSELLKRRPDIADLQLSCENTNTPVPYIDLVNELLERAILEGSTPPRASEPQTQTVGTAAELAAYPQHLDARVYSADLAKAVHPWILPFDLWAEEARAYLGSMDVRRSRIMEASFSANRAEALRDEAIAGEYLGFCPAERRIVTGQALSPARTAPEFWGFAPETADWVAQLHAVPALLERAGLNYLELREVLGTRFVDPSGALEIVSGEASCDTAKMTVPALDEPTLDRLHRFLRLQRRLSWTVRDTDRVLAALGPAEITPAVLVQISHIQRLRDRFHKSPADIAQWWASKLDTHVYKLDGLPVETSLYDLLFLSKSVNPNPAASPFRLAEPARSELADPSHKVADQLAAVLGALGVDAESLELIAATFPVTSPDPPHTSATLDLDLATLTALRRTPSLARAFKLSLRDFLGLVALTGIDPFDPAHTENIVLLAEEADRIKASGFSVADLEFVLLHRERPASSGASDKQIAIVFEELRKGLRKIRDDNIVVPDPTGETTGKKLALVIGGPAADRAIAILNGSASFTTPLNALPAAAVFDPPLADKTHYDPATKELQFLGPMTDAERDTLLGLSPDASYQAAVQSLHEQPRSFFREQFTFASPLAALPDGVVIPPALTAKATFDTTAHELRFEGAMSDTERATLLALSPQRDFQLAVTTLFQLAFLDPSEVATELLETDAKKPPEKIAWLLERLVPHVRDLLSHGLVKERVAAALGLPGAIVNELLVRWIHAGDQPAIASLLSLASLESPPTRDTAATQFDAMVRLLATARVILRFKLSPEEIAFAFDVGVHRGWLAFDELPSSSAPPDPNRYRAWGRMADYVSLRAAYPLHEPSLLDTFLSAVVASGGGAADRAAHLSVLATVTGWPLADLDYLTGATGFNLAYPDAFRDEQPLTRLRPMMALVAALGTSAEQVRGWATEGVSPEQAAEMVQAAKANSPPVQWLEVAKGIRDPLREKQRDALVAHLIAHPELTGDATIKKPDDLYRRYLVDVEMSACMPTSRIVQALAAIQLFVQRTLMNLEVGVVITADLAKQWSWMKNYRVWEANRKVFVSPENWIEPELRQDKTPFFKALEGELLQADVTADSAEDAIRHYLEQLDTVARLEPCGMYHQQEETSGSQPAIDVLHVIARTTSEPHRHFYRQLVDDGRWTPWEPLDIEIDADHVLPIVHNRRLYVYWPQMLEGASESTPSQKQDPPPPATKFTDVKLAWTERRKGKWTPKRVSGASIRLDMTKDWAGTVSLRAEADEVSGDLLIGGAFYLFGYTPLPDTFQISSADGSIGLTGDVVATPEAPPPATMPSFQAFVERQTIDIGFGPGGDKLTLPYRQWLLSAYANVNTLNATPGTYSLLTPHQYRRFASQDSFFFRDGSRTFFVRPVKRLGFFRAPKVFGPDSPVVVAPNWHDLYFGTLQQDPVWKLPHGDPGDPWIDPVEVVTQPTFPFRAVETTFAHDGNARGPIGIGPNGQERIGIRATPMAAAAPQRLATTDSQRLSVLPTALIALDAYGPQASTFQVLSAAGPVGSVWGRDQSPVALESQIALTRTGAKRSVEHRFDPLITRGPSAAAAIDVDAVHPIDIGAAVGGYTTVWYRQHYNFSAFYHPHVRSFMRELSRAGVDGVLQRKIQVAPETFLLGSHEKFDFGGLYKPNLDVVDKPLPAEDVDFSYSGAYAPYNWELFFHVPLLVALRLSKNQRFAEAQRWFHYIFDPTDASDDDVPRRFWRTRPFYENASSKPIEELLKLLDYDGSDPDSQALRADLEHQVEEWREHPFEPHLLAELRPVAYQKNVVMKYLDNLIAWGDQLFRQDTMESVAEATQLYVLAANILGEPPQVVPPRAATPLKSFNDLKDTLDAFSNAVVALENELPASEGTSKQVTRNNAPAPAAALGPTLYFCIPRNDKLLGYWDTVGDRLFKIRHCMNIEGVVRELSLFAPPIDPGLLVRAAAAGLSIDAALSAISASALPAYRFAVIVQRAHELCNELKVLGAQLLNALEKRDAEAIAAIRSSAEIELLSAARDVRKLQIDEAKAANDALGKSKEMASARETYYGGRPYTNPREDENVSSLKTAHTLQMIAQGMDVLAAGLSVIPLFDIGVSGAFSSPVAKVKIGGRDFANAVGFAKQALAMGASIATFQATMAQITGGFDRRQDDWQFQADQAKKEEALIDKQILGAEIRQQLAEHELANLELQIEQSKTAAVFLHDKFTNQELYEWMTTQIAQIFFQGYQLAYDTAKLAERAMQYELGDTSATFIEFGYWDSLRKGLLSGERLSYDLQRMERAYLDANKREYEITKHVSLALTDPTALLRLKTTGDCFVDLPEALFDLDYPGHYMRRLKTVSITIPAVTGPYTGVNCTLTLLRNAIRRTSSTGSGYERTGSEDDRFRDDVAAIQSIVTSSAQNDTGLFETNLRDERYLPFEGAGAISRWRIQLPPDFNHFDFDTISDVVLHLRYTAREAGQTLKTAAAASVLAGAARIGARLLSANSDFGDAWFRFSTPTGGDPTTRTLQLDLRPVHFPLQARNKTIKVTGVDLLLELEQGTDLPSPIPVTITPGGEGAEALPPLTMKKNKLLGNVPYATVSFADSEEKDLGQWSFAVPEAQYSALKVKDLLLLVHYATFDS
jgi:peptidoglycan hydrolase-like protein with peptidoglycan-binding domain